MTKLSKVEKERLALAMISIDVATEALNRLNLLFDEIPELEDEATNLLTAARSEVAVAKGALDTLSKSVVKKG